MNVIAVDLHANMGLAKLLLKHRYSGNELDVAEARLWKQRMIRSCLRTDHADDCVVLIGGHE